MENVQTFVVVEIVVLLFTIQWDCAFLCSINTQKIATGFKKNLEVHDLVFGDILLLASMGY